MAILFPNSPTPTVGQLYTFNNQTWQCTHSSGADIRWARVGRGTVDHYAVLIDRFAMPSMNQISYVPKTFVKA